MHRALSWLIFNPYLNYKIRFFHLGSDGRYGFEKYFKMYCVLHSSSNENWFGLSTNINQHCLSYNISSRLQFNSSWFPHNLFEMLLDWHTFSTCAPRWKHVWIHKYLCKCLLLICIKGKLVLLLDRTGYDSQETRPKFIDSQNFYFHFHYKLFCIKAVHLSNKLSLMCPRLWPIKDICIGLYVLKGLLNKRHILEKVMSMQNSFGEFSENKEELNWSLLEICS